jgi:endonuclease-3
MHDIGWQLERIAEMVDIPERQRQDPFRVLITTILSHRTRDENTEKAAERLFDAYPSAKALKDAPVDDIERLIRSTGFYTVKAERVKEVARIVDEELDGTVPDTRDGLVSLPGVGPKTANCVLVYAFEKDALPVDTHVHRIANRIGWVSTSSPEATEEALVEIVPRPYWGMLNETLVSFGKQICRPIGPRCAICTISATCDYYSETVSHIKEKH